MLFGPEDLPFFGNCISSIIYRCHRGGILHSLVLDLSNGGGPKFVAVVALLKRGGGGVSRGWRVKGEGGGERGGWG